MIILFLNKVFWCIFLMFIWFQTEAFPNYFKNKWYIHYFEYKKINPEISFPNFLLLKYPNFWTKLISCQPCLLVWILFFISSISDFSNFPIIYVVSYLMFRLFVKYS